MLQRAASNAYSWWWASHIRTKQSKWLDQNLQEMEEKVEHIIKIIEEDGESFAQRAEMYYRKRPELLNFVEDSFREYRALAERYDHLSRELQTANRTIATVCPEQVQLAIDDEDETLLSSSTHPNEKLIPFKNFPAAPKINIPEKNGNKAKKTKGHSMLMSQKGLLKLNVPNSGVDKKPRMMKEEALGKIDELQKTILGLQTEKEFVQSLYENGLAKYWEIEKKITEMQSKVNSLQDEYGIGTFIEDDEARTLMAATALKTCQEALVRLQGKQKRSEEEATLECERVKQVHEQIVFLKESLGEQTYKDAFDKALNLEEKNDSMEKNENDLEKLSDKINEHIQAYSSTSFTMSEMVEKIDDLVEKVITLETSLSSQNALITRLRLETNDLQSQIKSIQQDNDDLIKRSNKIVELEQELLGIKNLYRSIKNEIQNLQRCFTETSSTVDHLSEKLIIVKQDEKVENIAPRKDLASLDTFLEISNMDCNPSVCGEEENIDVPVTRPEMEIELNEVITASARDSNKVDDGIAYQNATMITKDNYLMRSNSKCLINSFPVSAEIKNAPNSSMRILLQEYQGMISQDRDWEISKIMGIEDLFETDYVCNQSDPIKGKVNFVHADGNNCIDDLFVNNEAIFDPREQILEQKKLGSTTNGLNSHDLREITEQRLFSFNPFDCNEGFKEHEGELAHANDIAASGKLELRKGGIYEDQNLKFNWSNPFDYLLTETQTTGVEEAILEGLNKEHKKEVKLNNDAMSSKETIFREKMNEDSIALVLVRGEESFVQSRSINPLISLTKERKKSIENGDIATLGDDKLISEHVKEVIEEITCTDENTKVKAHSDEKQIKSNPSAHDNIPRKVDKDQTAPSKEQHNEEDDQPDWKEMFVNGLENKEKVLLQQYTATLRNYKKTKKQLNDMEKKKQDCLCKSEVQITELKNANALKDAQIQSLHRKLDVLQVCLDENLESSSADSSNQQSIKDGTTSQVVIFQFPSLNQKQAPHLLDEQKVEFEHREEKHEGTEQIMISPEKGKQGAKRVVLINESDADLTVVEKFRSDIDELLEENIEFWLRFSTSFQQIQKFQTLVEDLQDELTKLGEIKRQVGGSKQHHSWNSDIRPIYNHLRETETELNLWLEHNALLEFDLRHRLASLSRLQGEISSVSNAETKIEDNGMNDYQAAKFQGEILNMKQENNQVVQKLQLGLERVKELQTEIKKKISILEEQLRFSATKNQKSSESSASRSKVPLRSFLFGVKLKKQRPSLFHCMSPALQKQYSDLQSVQT